MGGRGSGNWYRWDKKETTSNQHGIDIRWLKQQGCLDRIGSGQISWTYRGVGRGLINYWMEDEQMSLKYWYRSHSQEWQEVIQTVFFDRTLCNFGRFRKWFRCPNCQRRVAIIYGAGKYFACRKCYNLTYESCNEPRFQRMLNRAYMLKEKIGGRAGLGTLIPQRPRGMHRTTYEKLYEEILRLELMGEIGIFRKAEIIEADLEKYF